MLEVTMTRDFSAETVNEGVASLLENGFYVIEEALPPDHCRDAAQVLDDMIQRGQAREIPQFGFAIHPLCGQDSRLADVFCNPLAIAILGELFGEEPRLVHTGARVSEASQAPRIGWHVHRYNESENLLPAESPDRGVRPKRALAGWYLEGCSPETGPLVVWPRRFNDKLAAPFADHGAAWPGEVHVSCPPGSCVLFTCDLWHAAIAGTTDIRRHLFGAHFQGRSITRKHQEDHLFEGDAVERAMAANPDFGRLIRP